jgi:hypothetical protein
MDRRQRILMAMISASIAFLAITAVTATLRASSTPLYTYRMEQQSSEMNFLPTEKNTFTYEAEGGYVLNCGIGGMNCGCSGGVSPLNPYTCATCDEYYCEHPSECYGTCYNTCSTCSGNTCDETSCQNTCSTCLQYTCYYYTCWYLTCLWDTCIDYTCDWGTCVWPTCCWPTCYDC